MIGRWLLWRIVRLVSFQTVLHLLDVYMASNGSTYSRRHREVAALWDVLTALRGPDNGDIDLKVATTAIIRARAFPLTAGTRTALAIFGEPDGTVVFPPRSAERAISPGEHFIGHLLSACVVLDVPMRAEESNDLTKAAS